MLQNNGEFILLTWQDVEMRSFCSLSSMELGLIPNCSVLYLHANEMNSSKIKCSTAINIIVIKTHKQNC